MKVKSLIAAVLAVPVIFSGVAAAAPYGLIEGGDIYRVRNVTKNTDFADPATADACDVVQFKVRIHNPGPDPLTGVTVKATLNTEASTSHSSTITIDAENNGTDNPTTDTAGVNISTAQKMSYVTGSTELLDPNGAKLATLGDSILVGGVTLPGEVGVSVNQRRYVQFSAKVDCPVPPKTCEQTNTCPKPPTPPTSVKPVAKPAELPETGAGDVAAIAAGVSLLGAVLHNRFSRRFSK